MHGHRSTSTPAETLLVNRAGSLDDVIRAVGARFEAAHPGVLVRGDHGGSVDMALRATDPPTTPDVVATADYAIIPRLLIPRYATWYAGFAGNAIVLAYTDRSRHAAELTERNWVDLLLRPGVRGGYSDPGRDPGGYWAVLVMRLAEVYYRRPGLAARLEQMSPVVNAAAKQNLLDLLKNGEIDYLLLYRSTARSQGLRILELPAEINLGDPARAAAYGTVSLEVPREPGASDSVLIHGRPVIYGVTIPAAARHPELAKAFVRDLIGQTGQSILRGQGFTQLDRVITGGQVPLGVTE